MWLRTITGHEVTFLFESANEDHQQFMQPTATGFRGAPYTVSAAATELPDVVGGYALNNVQGVEECPAPAPVVEPEPAPKRRRRFTKNTE